LCGKLDGSQEVADAVAERVDGLAELLGRLRTNCLRHEHIKLGDRSAGFRVPGLLVEQDDEARHASGKTFGDVADGLGSIDV